jgi:hypothetical protein
MIKSKKEILEELINDQELVKISKEVGIKTLEKMDPEQVISIKFDGKPMKVKDRLEIMKKELAGEEIRLTVLKEEYKSL